MQSYRPPDTRAPLKPAESRGPVRPAAKASGAALTRTVKVRTPVRVPTVISHFVPADHKYEAEGSVTIVKGSGASTRGSTSGFGAGAQSASKPAPARVVKVQRKINRPSQSFSSASASADKLALTRTVSVRTPERVPTVISHFVPADHKYEATGSVTIVKGSQSSRRGSASGSSGGQSQFVARPAPAPRAPAPSVPRRPAPAPKRKVTNQFSGSTSSASNLALTRTVSVKSPERKSSVISHFLPAQHKYEATGSVTIARGSQSSTRGSVGGSTASRTQYVERPAVRVPAPIPASAPAPAPVRRVQVRKEISRPVQSSASAANLALTRTVSVKSPKRQPTVISHFVPAEHQYEATGSVTINRGSESSTRKISSGSSSGSGAASTFKSTPTVSAPSPAYSKPSRRVEVVRKASQPVRSSSFASSSDANLALTRTVSVKSPERSSSVISHFVPAEHQYEATGSVTIVKGSSGGRQSTAFGQASSGQRVSSGSASFGSGRGSALFGQASGGTSGQAAGRKTTSGQSQGGSFAASASSSKISGIKNSFSSSGKTSRRQESSSGSSASGSAGQASSGRVSFGASQGASAGAFGQASGSASRFSSGQSSASGAQKASSGSGRQDYSSARKQASSSASSSRSSDFGASASAQRAQAAAAAAAAAARDSSEESYSYQLAESYRGGSSVSAAELLAELKSFREDAARSGVKISQTKQSGRDDYDGSVSSVPQASHMVVCI